jgi:hypothetical protein
MYSLYLSLGCDQSYMSWSSSKMMCDTVLEISLFLHVIKKWWREGKHPTWVIQIRFFVFFVNSFQHMYYSSQTEPSVSCTDDESPHPDGVLKNSVRKKILHYRQLYTVKPYPIIFLSVSVNTSGRVYDDFVRSFFWHPHRETSVLPGKLPEESDQFRFLWVVLGSLTLVEYLLFLLLILISSTLFLSGTWCVFIFKTLSVSLSS